MPVLRLRHRKLGLDAWAQQIDGESTMLACSLVVAFRHGVGKTKSARKAYATYRTQHEQLIASGARIFDVETGRMTRHRDCCTNR